MLCNGLHEAAEGVSCDAIVAELYESPALVDRLVEEFGKRAVQIADDGKRELDRAWLRSKVISHPEKRKKLEEIVHPCVFQELNTRRLGSIRNGKHLFVAEIPLHYEIGEAITADLITVVAASRSVQVARMMENRGIDEHGSAAFIGAQLPIETKVEKADVVIWNDGGLQALETQVLLLINQLKHA